MFAKPAAGERRRSVHPSEWVIQHGKPAARQRKTPVAVSPLVRAGRIVVAAACVFVGFTGSWFRADPPTTVRAAPVLKRLAGRLDEHGQCYVNGLIDGQAFVLLVDSGASSLLFNRNHLPRGVDPAALRFDRKIATANGNGHAAGFFLREVRLGDFVLHDVPAFVGDARQTGDDAPLLGMSVLKLMHLEIGGGACALLWP
jgi:clan AA aspartic protease (TIGR02281 family)